MVFQVTLNDESVEWVDGARSYQQEGPMTTFFASDGQRGTLDCWSVKVASFRTDRVIKIIRLESRRATDDDARSVSPCSAGT